MRYYQEPNGDYLCVDPSTRAYYRRLGTDHMEGRATAISGLITSVCTTSVSPEFLRTCKRVTRAQIPVEWRNWLVGKE